LVKAIWNDTVLAESNNCHIVEGNYYFPPEDVKKEYLQSSDTRSVCPWKGETSYYSLQTMPPGIIRIQRMQRLRSRIMSPFTA